MSSGILNHPQVEDDQQVLTYNNGNHDYDENFYDDNDNNASNDYFEEQNIAEQEEMQYGDPADDEEVPYENTADGHYQYEEIDENYQDEYGATSQDFFKGSSTLVALKKLSMKGDSLDQEIKELEEELQNLSSMVSKANTFKREEQNILKENLALLTRKVEDRKRRENLFNNKTIPKRLLLTQDLCKIIQPGVKALKTKMLKNRTVHDGNGDKIKKIVEETRDELRNQSFTKIKFYGETKIECLTSMTNVEEWLKEIESIDKNLVIKNEELKNQEKEIGQLQTEIQRAKQDFDSIDLGESKKVLEDYKKIMMKEEEESKKELDHADKLYQELNKDIDDIGEKQDSIRSEAQDVIKRIDVVVEEKGLTSKKIQDLNMKIQESHLETLTIENNIRTKQKNMEILNKNIESSIDSLKNSEKDEMKLNDLIENCKIKESELTNSISQADANITELENKFRNITLEITQRNNHLLLEKKSQLDLIVESKKNEYYDKLAIICKQKEDIENNYAEMIKRFENIQNECNKKENELQEFIRENKADFDNLEIAFENKACDIKYIENQIENEIQTHANEMISLEKTHKDIIEKRKVYENNHAKLVSEIKEEIVMSEQKLECYEQGRQALDMEITNLNRKIEELQQIENEEHEKTENKEKTINELQMNLNDLNNLKIEKEEKLKFLQQERENAQTKLENVEIDLKHKKEMLQNSKNELAEVMKQVQILNEHTNLLNNLENKKRQAIEQEITNFKQNEENAIALFKEEMSNAEKSLANMKRSQANKIRMYETSELERMEKKRQDVKSKIERYQKDIELFKTKTTELEGKIEKKSRTIVEGKEKYKKIAQVLRESGMEDVAEKIDKQNL